MELGRTFYTTKGVNLEKYHLLSNVKKTYTLNYIDRYQCAHLLKKYQLKTSIEDMGKEILSWHFKILMKSDDVLFEKQPKFLSKRWIQ